MNKGAKTVWKNERGSIVLFRRGMNDNMLHSDVQIHNYIRQLTYWYTSSGFTRNFNHPLSYWAHIVDSLYANYIGITWAISM